MCSCNVSVCVALPELSSNDRAAVATFLLGRLAETELTQAGVQAVLTILPPLLRHAPSHLVLQSASALLQRLVIDSDRVTQLAAAAAAPGLFAAAKAALRAVSAGAVAALAKDAPAALEGVMCSLEVATHSGGDISGSLAGAAAVRQDLVAFIR